MIDIDVLTRKQSISTMQNCATYIQILKMFMKTLQIILKKDLTHQIMKSIDHYQ